MPQRLRKFIGTILLIALVVLYSLVATTIAVAKLPQDAPWLHLFYFLFTGILWILPALLIVNWMLKPDRQRKQ